MKEHTINKRSNAYRAGEARTRKIKHALTDNPYRAGTRQWHEWKAGFKHAVQAFVASVMDSANEKSAGTDAVSASPIHSQPQ